MLTQSLDYSTAVPIILKTRRYRIPCMLMRGGTSRGLFFLASDLPGVLEVRDRVLLGLMGTPQFNRVDGIGGMNPVTSKLAIISPATVAGADVDYLFGQVNAEGNRIDYSANCGNILSAVGPFALERGLVKIVSPETVVRIHNVNTGVIVHARIKTPENEVLYEGSTSIDGAPGFGAPISLHFIDSEGAITGKLLPTGQLQETILGIRVSCVDAAVAMVILKAADLGLSGYESPEDLNLNQPMLECLEHVRLEAGRRMGLGDCSRSVIPKVCLVAPAMNGGHVSSRYFTPFKCHPSHAVTGALCLGVAALIPGTIAYEVAQSGGNHFQIEHPSGSIEADLQLVQKLNGEMKVSRAAFVRTASRILDGIAFYSDIDGITT